MSDDEQREDDEQQPQPPWPGTPMSLEAQQILADLRAKQEAFTVLHDTEQWHETHMACCQTWEEQIIEICQQVLAAVEARPYLNAEFQMTALKQHFGDVAVDLTRALHCALAATGAEGLEDRARSEQGAPPVPFVELEDLQREPPADPGPAPVPPIPVPGDGHLQ